jgi:chromosome segregation ATPase
LEHERNVLREALFDGEAAMRELGIQFVELQSSEKLLRDEVGRLKAKEEWMISRNDELMDLVGRLEDSVKNHRAAENELRSRAERHCAGETELGRELEEVRDELRAVETRYRRWVAQLDDEKVRLQLQVDELTEKNSDLEGREAGLLCRIKKLEATEFGLRSEVADLERALIEASEDRDHLMMQVRDMYKQLEDA